MSENKIVLLAGKGESTNMVYHFLHDRVHLEKVIIEAPVPRREFLKKRVKHLGISKVAGQVLFELLVVPCLRNGSRARAEEIARHFGLDNRAIDDDKMVHVDSVNSETTVALLRQFSPEVVVVNGTRIISKTVLDSVAAKFINIHAGITPLFRGVHGGYWALVENDSAACGVTVHLVDTGIDTGNILGQGLIQPTAKDNFLTYPLLQLAVGLPLLEQAIRDVCSGRFETKHGLSGNSRLWSHPTLAEYLSYRVRKGVK
jgi:folate-dependent phosphoribosylglycinamide formyltransferase PurN